MGIKFVSKGDFSKTTNFLNNLIKLSIPDILQRYGDNGVAALQSYTPRDSSLTANSWYYEIEKIKNGWSISWLNSNVVNGVPIAIILQYGHGTRNGGYVEGTDYINPSLFNIFNDISEEAWREVINS